ncbi:MAG: hypothetical protein IJ647_01585 [Prevotella sp.]|nr:hypothetical protein [Prevotella sp.]
MKLQEIIETLSLKAAGRSVGLEVAVAEGRLAFTPMDPDDPRYSTDFILPSMRMVEACRADDFDFFQPFIEAGRLTAQQMHRAAARYHLGKTRSGKPLFWMISETLDPMDAHIASDDWLSSLLKARQPLLQHWCPTHCLFGQHLLSTLRSALPLLRAPASLKNSKPSTTLRSALPLLRAPASLKNSELYTLNSKPVAIVESEASAAVLSELFPEVLWMAYATVEHLDVALFAPLQGRAVAIYPSTDPSASTYLFFLDLAEAVRQRYDIHISVASILEDLATPPQKDRCIDLLDFLRESLATD